MTALITPRARAYVNHGRWVAECPYDCGSALALGPRETTFKCTECLTISTVEWPEDPDGIWEALLERRLPRTRNWFPQGHTLAVRCHAPMGQTPDELRREQKEYEEQDVWRMLYATGEETP